MPVVYQELITLGLSVVLPIQPKRRTSKATPDVPMACSEGMFWKIACRTVPSRGAELVM